MPELAIGVAIGLVPGFLVGMFVRAWPWRTWKTWRRRKWGGRIYVALPKELEDEL